VRFFSIGSTNVVCNPATEDRDPTPTHDCSPDEFCTLGGFCVPRSAEVRFCMARCGGNGDCRKQYECRNLALMMAHGGEPVPPPGVAATDNLINFCAPNGT
jgi:hypothetical protein